MVGVERSREHEKPPTLFDLTGLQKTMSERHGVTAEQTLAGLQHLYEMKIATYPRTDSKYITHDDLDTLNSLLKPKYALGFLDGGPVNAIHDLYVGKGFDAGRCVADDKVAGHTAILPTTRLTYDVFNTLPDTERKIMATILTRMWAACASDRIHDVARVKAVVDAAGPDGTVERVPLSASADTWNGVGPASNAQPRTETTFRTGGGTGFPTTSRKGAWIPCPLPCWSRARPHRRNRSPKRRC